MKYAADILHHLKELYEENSRHERFTAVKELMTSHMRDATLFREHGFRMIGLIEKLSGLDIALPHELSVDLLLLSPKYAADILHHLKELYGENSRHERFTAVKELMMSRMRDATLFREHGFRMIGLIEKLSGLDIALPHELSVDLLLLSLPTAFLTPLWSTST
ncbi:hypothetical protein F511_32983 [Dorcoceras hygrometricum]|uniref:Uncharacterized protein n=1 Tax=Dorcoceras hygrometricum TaxID=472368 RepID=A0A2Z7AS83_9LAMI|nr:hypothetical protein F511_32983 [Dorcoceras hygrometricum]